MECDAIDRIERDESDKAAIRDGAREVETGAARARGAADELRSGRAPRGMGERRRRAAPVDPD